ncbi:MAG: hypothetical protein Q7U51_14000 [Methanoregula sp.]|nr:hypothetical protein [Methanoregula sp.]
MFSVLKRKFGESLKARKYRLQVKEIKIKVILYNLSRMISTFAFLILFKEFYRAEFFNALKPTFPRILGDSLPSKSIGTCMSPSKDIYSEFLGYRIIEKIVK